jgi:hypothetical protein
MQNAGGARWGLALSSLIVVAPHFHPMSSCSWQWLVVFWWCHPVLPPHLLVVPTVTTVPIPSSSWSSLLAMWHTLSAPTVPHLTAPHFCPASSCLQQQLGVL